MSKLKAVRGRISATDALVAATSVASIIAHVSDMLQFIPARAAATVTLVILQTIQEIDNNKVACYKLARRSAKVLVDLNVRIAGRWHTAPVSLVENIREFEKVLECIRDFMQELSKVGWMGRLLKKGSIEAALSDFHDLLDDAERTFQVASLIEIHYTVGLLEARSATTDLIPTKKAAIETRLDITKSVADILSPECCDTPKSEGLSKSPAKNSFTPESTAVIRRGDIIDAGMEHDIGELQLQEELKELENFGFKRFHQADLQLLSETKFSNPESFWKHTMVADAGGTRVLVKRYDKISECGNDCLKRWLHDIKVLKNLYHPNLPQLTGYSDERSPVPFILLAQAKLRDPGSFLLNALRRMSISECAITVLKMYRDISSAALHVQRQMAFDERQTQVFISEASYALDTESGKIVLGIPPPQKEGSYQGFGYPLTESLLSTTLKILPAEKSLSKELAQDIVGLQNKLAHLRALAYVLLPAKKPELCNVSEELLEDADFSPELESMPLSRIRKQCINAGMHEFSWDVAIHSCPNSFDVGDIGYIRHDGGCLSLTDASRFNHFVKVGNVFDEPLPKRSEMDGMDTFSLIREVTGAHGQWINGFYRSEEAWPFVVPGDVEGWAVSLSAGTKGEVHTRHSCRLASVNEAWRYLLQHAKDRAAIAGVDLHELILITKTVHGQIYRIHDWNPTRSMLPAHQSPVPHGNPRFQHRMGQHQQLQLPRILYLFTSYRGDFEPFVAENPSAATNPGVRSDIRGVTLSTAWCKPEAFIGYIQLSAEDFL